MDSKPDLNSREQHWTCIFYVAFDKARKQTFWEFFFLKSPPRVNTLMTVSRILTAFFWLKFPAPPLSHAWHNELPYSECHLVKKKLSKKLHIFQQKKAITTHSSNQIKKNRPRLNNKLKRDSDDTHVRAVDFKVSRKFGFSAHVWAKFKT